MDEIVARCQDCGREDRDAFAVCPWCGRRSASRWWCVACHDWRPARTCPACAGGLGVPSELSLGPCAVGGTIAFSVVARNAGKKLVWATVSSPDAAVAIANPTLLVPACGTADVRGTVTLAPAPTGHRTFRLVFGGPVSAETVLAVDAVPALPRLEFVPPLVALRTPNPGSVVRTSVRLKNTGNVALMPKLSSAATWLTPEPKGVALAPGESAEVKLRARSKKTDSGTLEAKLVAEAPGGRWELAVCYALPEPELTAEAVAFGELKPGAAAFADVVVRNVGRVRVECTLAAADPWLRVVPARVILPPGRSKRVRVRALLTDEHDGPLSSELRLSVGGAVLLRVPVTATGKVPKPILRAVRRQRIRAAVGPPVERKFQIANDGDGRLDVTATADKPWVTIATPELRVAPGKKRKLRYVIDLSVLPRGEHSATITLATNAGTVAVPVAVQVLDPNPLLEVVPAPHLGLISPEQTVSAFVQVRNAGIGFLRVKAQSENPLVAVSPAEADVPPGPPVRFNLTIPVGGLPGGEYEAAVHLTSNGGSGRAVARFALTPEQLDAPTVLDLGPREAGRPRWDWLWVRNTGQYAVTLRVRAEQGVKLGKERVTVASLETVPIPFYLELPADVLGPVTGAIHLEGRALRHCVEVRAVARKVELVLKQPHVNLGLLRPGEERAFTVEVVNAGEVAAEIANVQQPGELEVRVRKATVPPGGRVALVGAARANTEQTGEDVWTTVPLGYGLKLRCEARVERPVLPRVVAVTAATGGLVAGGALSVVVGWWLGVPLALLGLVVAVWIFWRETL